MISVASCVAVPIFSAERVTMFVKLRCIIGEFEESFGRIREIQVGRVKVSCGRHPTQYILKLNVKPAVERIRVESSAFFATVRLSVIPRYALS